MTVAVFYYDGFAEFEIAQACLILHHQHEIVAIALEDREYKSESQQRFCVDQVVRDVDVDCIDLLIIPGGNPVPLVDNQELKTFVESLLAKGKKVAGICGGAGLLAGFGLLKGKKCTGMTSGVVKPGDDSGNAAVEYGYYAGATVSDEHVVVDGNIITAQGQAFAEFAVGVARWMGVYDENPDEYDQDLKWLKNIR